MPHSKHNVYLHLICYRLPVFDDIRPQLTKSMHVSISSRVEIAAFVAPHGLFHATEQDRHSTGTERTVVHSLFAIIVALLLVV